MPGNTAYSATDRVDPEDASMRPQRNAGEYVKMPEGVTEESIGLQ